MNPETTNPDSVPDMPIIFQVDYPEHWVPKSLHAMAETLKASYWPNYILRVIRPLDYVAIRSHPDPDCDLNISPINHTATWSYYQFAAPEIYRGTFTPPFRYHLPKGNCLIRYQLQDSFVEDDVTTDDGIEYETYNIRVDVWAQPIIWIRSDDLAEFLGTTGPGVHMEPEILADWIQDREGDSKIVTRLRALIKSNTANEWNAKRRVS